jgi:predicted dehydrogenase
MKSTILIVGLGSIGIRHLNNLVKLGFKNISIVTRLGEIKAGFEEFKFYSSISDACNTNIIDTAVIASPTSCHIQNLIEVLENNVKNIYLEKPISHNLDNIENVDEILRNSGSNLIVGYDLRFDPGLILLKKYLKNGVIGKVGSFIAEVGQYLPEWRPSMDYRNSMSAKKSSGGGVMLDLVHEFDYINWLLGPVKSIVGMNGKTSKLEIDTEDVSVNLIETTQGALGSIHLDYLQSKLTRSCKVIGDDGVIIWNYGERSLKLITHEEKKCLTHDFSEYDRNNRFMDVMKAFMDSRSGVSNDKLVSFSDAVCSLKLVELSKRSYKSMRVELI